MDAPIIPDIDRRIAGLAIALLFVLAIAYLAYMMAERAGNRSREALYVAEDAHSRATAALAQLPRPRAARRRSKAPA